MKIVCNSTELSFDLNVKAGLYFVKCQNAKNEYFSS